MKLIFALITLLTTGSGFTANLAWSEPANGLLSDSHFLPKETDKKVYLDAVAKEFLFMAGTDKLLNPKDRTRLLDRCVAQQEGRLTQDFYFVDQDADGVLTFPEVESYDLINAQGGARERFERYDENMDGVVSLREWITARKGQEGTSSMTCDQSVKDDFKRYMSLKSEDAVSLSEDELRGAAGSLFDHYDKDHDGKLSDEELFVWQNAVVRETEKDILSIGSQN